MLVGRSAECELLRRLVAGARDESAGVILLRGEPGIGKTSLLTFAAGAADGFRVLQIQGHESEIEIPFAGLSWLLESLTGLLSQLPPVQAEALAGALQLGSAAGSGRDRLAVAAATLTLLAAAADAQPLLVAVDDGHWLDVPSLEAIVWLIAEANQVEPQDPAWSAAMQARHGERVRQAGQQLDHAALTSAMLGDQRLAAAEGQRASRTGAPACGFRLPGPTCGGPACGAPACGAAACGRASGAGLLARPVSR